MDIEIKPTGGKGVTPIQPIEPTPEAKAMTFSMDESLLSNDNTSTILIDNKEIKEEPKVEVKSKEEPILKAPKEEKVIKVEDKPKVEEVKKEEPKSVLKPPTADAKIEKDKVIESGKEEKSGVKLITPVKKEGEDVFDYSKYSPFHVDKMKNMAKFAREAYATLVEENKQLSTLKDSNYLQHAQGYTLSPEFQDLQVRNYKAEIEGNCWKQALLKIRKGEEYQEIVGFDKNNNPVLSKLIKPTDEDEIRINNNLIACVNATNELGSKLQIFPNQFKERINQDMQLINQEQHNRFAWVQDPKLLDYSITVEGQGDKKLKDIKQEFKSMFPSYLAQSPGVDVASNLMIALMIQGAELKEARNGKQVAEIQSKEQSRVEPSSDNREVNKSTTLPNGAAREFSLAGMPER